MRFSYWCSDVCSSVLTPRYRNQLSESAASAVVMRADDAQGHAVTALVAADPYVAFAKIAALFDPPPPLQPGIHASAVVDPGARIDPQDRKSTRLNSSH